MDVCGTSTVPDVDACNAEFCCCMHLQVVATGWNHKALVWQDDDVDTVSEYRMFAGHRWASWLILAAALVLHPAD